MDSKGFVLYKGLHKKYEGYMNRAHLMQNAEAVDIRNVEVCDKLKPVLEQYLLRCKEEKNPNYVKASLEFCEKIKEMGYEVMYWEP